MTLGTLKTLVSKNFVRINYNILVYSNFILKLQRRFSLTYVCIMPYKILFITLTNSKNKIFWNAFRLYNYFVRVYCSYFILSYIKFYCCTSHGKSFFVSNGCNAQFFQTIFFFSTYFVIFGCEKLGYLTSQWKETGNPFNLNVKSKEIVRIGMSSLVRDIIPA